MTQINSMISGPAALEKRDVLEAAVTLRFPAMVQPMVSRTLTWVTGLAPSSSVGEAHGGGTEARAFAMMMGALGAGATGVLAGGGFALPLGAGLLLIHGMRQFSSVVGHHLTHRTGKLGLRRFVYDVISGLLLLPRFDAYRRDHLQHHAYTAGPNDTDQRFIAYLGARFDGALRFGLTVVEPRFHWRFVKARLRAVLMEGPWWRRLLALGGLGWLAFGGGLAAWTLFAGIGFQVATLVQWSSEHLWGKRPEGKGAVDTAVAVTYGRLLIPDPEERGWWLKLAAYALFRLVLVTGDLNNHDLHHVGRGPWTAHAWVRTALLMEGRLPLRQTNGLRAMFGVAFASARGADPLPIRKMDDGQMLGMM